MLKRTWKDPVWSKVIATAIVAGGAAAIGYFAGWWPDVVGLGRGFVTFSMAETAIPNWLLILLSLCTLGVVVVVAIVVWEIAVPSRNQPSFRNYKVDEFFGIRWRWQYNSSGQMHSLFSFCPVCDLQVWPQHASAYDVIDRFDYRCDDCCTVLHRFDKSPSEVEDLVTRQIQRKLRNDSQRMQE